MTTTWQDVDHDSAWEQHETNRCGDTCPWHPCDPAEVRHALTLSVSLRSRCIWCEAIVELDAYPPYVEDRYRAEVWRETDAIDLDGDGRGNDGLACPDGPHGEHVGGQEP